MTYSKSSLFIAATLFISTTLGENAHGQVLSDFECNIEIGTATTGNTLATTPFGTPRDHQNLVIVEIEGETRLGSIFGTHLLHLTADIGVPTWSYQISLDSYTNGTDYERVPHTALINVTYPPAEVQPWLNHSYSIPINDLLMTNLDFRNNFQDHAETAHQSLDIDLINNFSESLERVQPSYRHARIFFNEAFTFIQYRTGHDGSTYGPWRTGMSYNGAPKIIIDKILASHSANDWSHLSSGYKLSIGIGAEYHFGNYDEFKSIIRNQCIPSFETQNTKPHNLTFDNTFLQNWENDYDNAVEASFSHRVNFAKHLLNTAL